MSESSAAPLCLSLAQINPLVGDIRGNAAMILDGARAAAGGGASVAIFPELTLSGYPPEDLLLRPQFIEQVAAEVEALSRALGDDARTSELWTIFGYPRRRADKLFNMLGVFHRGRMVAEYAKRCLPNYRVFDEKRYFAAGRRAVVCEIQGVAVGLSICEDIWEQRPIAEAVAAGARLIVNSSASPFHRGKSQQRARLLAERARAHGAPIVYVNAVGAQDELVFDGGSMAVGADGSAALSAPRFVAGNYFLQLRNAQGPILCDGDVAEELSDLEEVYQALILGLRDYARKNKFRDALLGLSGGIDSALTLALAVDALGSEHVTAVMMPSRHTADISVADAEEEARRLGAHCLNISIEPIYAACLETLAPQFGAAAADETEQNLQARCRGVVLMALSNKRGGLLLTTGNKSEMAVGYATLYGDMSGGFNPLKDVPKTLVYALAAHRNRHDEVIPRRVLEREPSAELLPDQKDSDNLPPYEILDGILQRYIDEDRSIEEIVADGFAREVVEEIARRVLGSEYKRRQSAPGVRISQRGFGRDRRYPITSGWRG